MTADIHFSPLALTHALPFLPLRAKVTSTIRWTGDGEPGLIDELVGRADHQSRAYGDGGLSRRTARPRRARGL